MASSAAVGIRTESSSWSRILHHSWANGVTHCKGLLQFFYHCRNCKLNAGSLNCKTTTTFDFLLKMQKRVLQLYKLEGVCLYGFRNTGLFAGFNCLTAILKGNIFLVS
jgi:hypothetical protein